MELSEVYMQEMNTDKCPACGKKANHLVIHMADGTYRCVYTISKGYGDIVHEPKITCPACCITTTHEFHTLEEGNDLLFWCVFAELEQILEGEEDYKYVLYPKGDRRWTTLKP